MEAMDVRNRMADVVKLRNNVLQDFMEMILRPGWQQKFYAKAKNEVVNNTRYKNNYIAAYEKMRDKGYENYSVKDMDVSIIYQIVKYVKNITLSVDDYTLRIIESIKNDRNLTNHSSENETPEELYLRGLVALIDLRELVCSVDKNITAIDDNTRLNYRQKYVKAIEEMKDLLDDERIELVQSVKNIKRDIANIQNSKNPLQEWITVQGNYSDRWLKLHQGREGYFRFIRMASDAGIQEAHYHAALCEKIENNCSGVEYRLLLEYEGLEKTGEFDFYYAEKTLDLINWCLEQSNYTLTPGLEKIINKISSIGFQVKKTDAGMYIVSKP